MTALENTPCLLCDANDAEPFIESRAQMSPERTTFTFVRCRRCRLVYLDPRVTEADIDRYYDAGYLPHRGASAWGRYAPFAAEGERRTDKARVRWAVRSAQLDAGSRALDVGCGRPTFLEAQARVTGAAGVGVDFSDAGWAADPGRWEQAGLELHRGRLTEVPLGGSFDLITMWHALEHEYRPLDILRRLRALAACDATLIVEVPNLDSLTRRLQGAEWAGYHTPRHTAVYSPATLRAMLERAGWNVVTQARFGTLDPYVLWWLGRQEQAGNTLTGNLERRFLPFMAGKILTLPVAMMKRWVSLGIQVAVARASSSP